MPVLLAHAVYAGALLTRYAVAGVAKAATAALCACFALGNVYLTERWGKQRVLAEWRFERARRAATLRAEATAGELKHFEVAVCYIGHELRNPLHGISGALDALIAGRVRQVQRSHRVRACCAVLDACHKYNVCLCVCVLVRRGVVLLSRFLMIRAQEDVPTELQAIRSGVTMMVKITSELLDLERLRMGAIVPLPVATLTLTLLQECAGQARTLVLALAVSRCQFCLTSIISSFLACVLWLCAIFRASPAFTGGCVEPRACAGRRGTGSSRSGAGAAGG